MALSELDKAIDAATRAITAPGEQLEVARQTIGGIEYPMFAKAPETLRDYAALFFSMQADKEFTVYHDERQSFADVQAKAVAIAGLLQSRYGIAKGDRVAIAMRNYPEWIPIFLGAAMLGAVLVPLNAWWTAEGLAYGLQHCGARLVFVDEQRLRLLTEAGDRLPLMKIAVRTDADVARKAGADTLDAALAAGPVQLEYLPPIYPDDDCMIMYTSGTTGTPKGAVSTQRAVVSAALNYVVQGLVLLRLQQQQDPTATPPPQAVLLHLPLFHITGLMTVFLASLPSGSKIVIMDRWDAGEALRLIEREKCTLFIGVPTMSLELMQHPDRDKHDLSSLGSIAGGGAPRPSGHVKRLAETFPAAALVNGYGLTETTGVGTGNFGANYLAKPASAGRPSGAVVELGIFDDDMTAVPTGDTGEICFRSVANARGYWRDPQSTAEAFVRGGWFRTGDLGYVDADGYLFIVDRKKDIIIRGGENISAVDVEEALYANADIAEAAVFGLPDERLGEVVGAVVHARPGASLDRDAVIAEAASQLEHFKVPAELWVAAEPLPKLGSGKIDKMRLRKTYQKIWTSGAGN